jgi:lysophospholipase L1-like esterase
MAPLPIDYLLGLLVWIAALVGLFLLLLSRRRKVTKGSVQRRWIDGGLSLWMVLAILTGCELVFALFVDHSDTFNMTNVSKRWFDRHVDAQRNRFGARDAHEFVRKLPDGVNRICFVGDSFTIGHGIREVGDRFSDLVAAGLEREFPGRFVVDNLGDPGLEASQIAARVEGLLQEKCDINTVIYVFCLNDIEGYDEQTDAAIESLRARQPSFFLFTKTFLFNWLYFRFVQFTQPEVKEYFPHLRESYTSDAWDSLSRKLDALYRECRESQVQLRMVVFPFMQDLGADYPFRAAHEKLVGFCREREIPVLDLEPVFRDHADEPLTVNRYDAHPNELAHRIAADAILSQLQSDLRAANGESQ